MFAANFECAYEPHIHPLQVIEYVKFLQEKVQKYESCTGGDWSQEHAKLVPWVIQISLASSVLYISMPANCYAMPVESFCVFFSRTHTKVCDICIRR
jgi:hypothetical protein